MTEALGFLVGLIVGGVGAGIALALGRSGTSQSCYVRGAGNVVNQSGCTVSGDIVGGDLVRKDKSGGRCEYCGASK